MKRLLAVSFLAFWLAAPAWAGEPGPFVQTGMWGKWCSGKLCLEVWTGEGAAATAQAEPAGSAAHGHAAAQGPDEEVQYSIFMHDTAGMFLIVISLCAFLGGFESPWLAWLRGLWPAVWIAMGLFLFVRSDPDAWPMGAAGLWESVTSLPTAHQVIQHKVLTLVAVFIGALEWLKGHRAFAHPAWAYVMPTLWAVAALALLLHRHLEHPQMDLANMQHLSWGIQGLLLAIIRLLEDTKVVQWSHKAGLWTVVLGTLGLQIALYTE
jgi:putative copper resistance protein D